MLDLETIEPVLDEYLEQSYRLCCAETTSRLNRWRRKPTEPRLCVEPPPSLFWATRFLLHYGEACTSWAARKCVGRWNELSKKWLKTTVLEPNLHPWVGMGMVD